MVNNYYKLAVFSRDEDGKPRVVSWAWTFNDEDADSELTARAALLWKHTALLADGKFPQLSAWRPNRYLPADQIGRFGA